MPSLQGGQWPIKQSGNAAKRYRENDGDMTKQKDKTALLHDIQSEHHRLDRVLDNLTPQDMLQGGVIGDWSVKDILAHLTAWEQVFLHWYRCGLSGKSSDIEPVGMGKKAIDALNQRFYDQYAGHNLEDVLANFLASYQEILAVVNETTEEELFSPGRYAWTGKYILVDYLMSNTGNHYRWARQKIHHWWKVTKESA